MGYDEELWDIFKKTGSVEVYLEYKNSLNTQEHLETNNKELINA